MPLLWKRSEFGFIYTKGKLGTWAIKYKQEKGARKYVEEQDGK